MEQPKKQLNPFAFPAETDVRFTLFVVAALFWIIVWMPSISEMLIGVFVGPNSSPAGDALANNLSQSFAIPALVLAVAALLWVLYPGRLIRREKLEPLDPQGDPTFSAAIQDVEQTAGVNAAPAVMLRNGNQIDGQAFGMPRHYILRLNQGLRLALRKAPARFHAVVAHELAHIVNRDITRTYFAQALWTATIYCTMIPFLAALVITMLLALFVWHPVGADIWQKIFLVKLPLFVLIATPFLLSALIVLLLRASLLRVREAYADWRAVLWGARDGLEQLLGQHADLQQNHKTNWRGRISEWLKLHPTSGERLGYVREPARLFRITRELPLFVGWLAAVIALGEVTVIFPAMQRVNDGTKYLIDNLTLPSGNNVFTIAFLYLIYWLGWLVAIVPLLILGYLVIGSLGLSVFRHAVADTYFERRGIREYLRLFVPALMMIAGLSLSTLATPTFLVGSQYPETYFSFLVFLPLYFLGIWVCLAIARFLGIRLLAEHIGSRPPTWKRRGITAYISALLAIFLFLFTSQQFLIPTVATLTQAELAEMFQKFDVIELVPVSVGFVCLWFFILPCIFAGLIMLNRLRPRHCPQCGTPTKYTQVVGKQCTHCGAELAVWAVVQ